MCREMEERFGLESEALNTRLSPASIYQTVKRLWPQGRKFWFIIHLINKKSLRLHSYSIPVRPHSDTNPDIKIHHFPCTRYQWKQIPKDVFLTSPTQSTPINLIGYPTLEVPRGILMHEKERIGRIGYQSPLSVYLSNPMCILPECVVWLKESLPLS